MLFDFDPDKSNTNKQKHGIDFVEAQELWLDGNLLQVPARALDEPRLMVIGKIQDKHWSAIFTPRNQSIRIISVRRSRREEIQLYESTGI
jgi:uncharacterized DUF497 family protein